MLYLIERETGEILEKYNKDFNKFINEEWGGMFSYLKDGQLNYWNSLGCHYDYAYWSDTCCKI